MSRFRRAYGAGPLHLIAGMASLAVGAWALWTVLGLLGRPANFARWFGGAIVVHDLVFLPLYSLLGVLVATALVRGDGSPRRVAVLNHVRVPALLAGLALLVWFPLVLRTAPGGFERATGYANDFYLGRWLALTAVLFGLSALVLVLRWPRLERNRPHSSP